MYDLMKGIKVVEVSEYLFVPCAGTVLADWGAEVIKIERTTGGGDPMRGVRINLATAGPINAMIEVCNRGKRSVALDLHKPEGRAELDKLLANADVFTTSLRSDARRKLRLEPDDLFALNPRLIYARGTGYGLRGPLAEAGGYDWPTAWCRTGIAHAMTPAGGEPPMQPGSFGDLMAGLTLAGAIAAALARRERTGQGAIVDNSLYATGLWMMCQRAVASPFLSFDGGAATRADCFDALSNTYRTSDDRWICINFLQDRWWPDFCRHAGCEELMEDPNFASYDARAKNKAECVAALDRVFEKRTYVEWLDIMKNIEGVWAPVQSIGEAALDPASTENGFVTPVRGPGAEYLGVASPAQFDGKMIGELTPAPSPGQHTVEVLTEFGATAEEIARLRAAGAIP